MDTVRVYWEKYPNHFAETYKELLEENIFSDVTLVSDDQVYFQAHRIVLSACSPVLKHLLLTDPQAHPMLFLRNINQRELKSLLSFMYFGEVAVQKNSIQLFLDIAAHLTIKELKTDKTKC